MEPEEKDEEVEQEKEVEQEEDEQVGSRKRTSRSRWILITRGGGYLNELSLLFS